MNIFNEFTKCLYIYIEIFIYIYLSISLSIYLSIYHSIYHLSSAIWGSFEITEQFLRELITQKICHSNKKHDKNIFKIFIVAQLHLSPFSPPLLSPALPATRSHIQSSSLLSFSMGPLYMFLDLTLPLPSPIIPLLSPFWALSPCSLFPCLWSIFITCLFFWLGSTYRGDRMVFVFYHLAYFT